MRVVEFSYSGNWRRAWYSQLPYFVLCSSFPPYSNNRDQLIINTSTYHLHTVCCRAARTPETGLLHYPPYCRSTQEHFLFRFSLVFCVHVHSGCLSGYLGIPFSLFSSTLYFSNCLFLVGLVVRCSFVSRTFGTIYASLVKFEMTALMFSLPPSLGHITWLSPVLELQISTDTSCGRCR